MMKDEKVKIEYPSQWNYKIIIHTYADIEELVKNVVADRTYKITKSNNSKNNTYESYKVTLLVHSDEDRTALFHEFKKQNGVKIVL